jgi:hypothetical protein
MPQIKVVYVDKKIAGFWGMNARAARALGVKKYFPFKNNEVAVFKHTTPGKKKWLKEHETNELKLMGQGLPYREAHARTMVQMGDYATLAAARRDADRMMEQAKRWKKRHRTYRL